MCRLSWNLGASTFWNLQVLSRPVMGLLYHGNGRRMMRLTCKPSVKLHKLLNLNCYIYLLTPWCRVLLEKLTGLQLVKKFPAFHRTRRFITALTSVRHMSLSLANPIQSKYPHPTSWRSILILSTHLRLGLPSGLLPSSFPTKTLYTPLSSPIRATCPFVLLKTLKFSLHCWSSGLHFGLMEVVMSPNLNSSRMIHHVRNITWN